MTDFRYDMDIGHLQMNMIEVFMQKVLPVGSKEIKNSSSLDTTGKEGEDQMKCHSVCQKLGQKYLEAMKIPNEDGMIFHV